MWQRLVIGFLLAVAAYFVVKYFSAEGFTNWISVTEIPSSAPPLQETLPRMDAVVSSGGPNSPAIAPPRNMPPKLVPPPEASDPYDETAESAYAPETVRNPERSFSPGVVPEQTAIASSSGIAGPPASSSQAFQQFGPELVSNGGNFFGSVSALENENPNYSAF
jgi:hypothetical protein